MIEYNLLQLLLILVATLSVQYALVRRQVTSIIDPFFYFVLTSAFSLAWACFAVDNSWLLARIFFYFSCFYFGFLKASGPFKRPNLPLQMSVNVQHFRSIVIVCSLVYLGFNMIIWMKSGIILFSSEPSLQKFDAYAGGLGFVRRFNWSVGGFVLIASLYWWLFERKALALFFVIINLFIAISGGAKGSLLNVILATGLFIANPFLTNKLRDDTRFIRRIIPLLMIISLIPAIIVLIIENGSAEAALGAFFIRLFFFADVLNFWGLEFIRIEFAGLGPLDYLRDSFGSLLGQLGLMEYPVPIGNQFMKSALAVGEEYIESTGPNTPFYVRGELFFGIFFAPLYAFLIGLIFGRLRMLFLSYRGHSILKYSLISFVSITSLTLMTEEGLFISQVCDFIIFFLPIYAVVTCAHMSIRPSCRDYPLPEGARL